MPQLPRLPCGQFFPGEFPRPASATVGNGTVIPPVYTGGGSSGGGGGGGGRSDPRGGPGVPGPAHLPTTGPGRGGGPGGPRGVGPATPGPAGPAGVGPAGPGTGGGRGPNPPGPRGATTGGAIGPQPPGPAGPTGGGIDRGPGGPTTGGGGAIQCFRCVVGDPRPCPPNTTGNPSRERRKIACSPAEANADGSEARNRKRSGQGWADNGPWNDNAKGLCLVAQGTLFDGCVPDPYVCMPRIRTELTEYVTFTMPGVIGESPGGGGGGGEGGGQTGAINSPTRVNSVVLQQPNTSIPRRLNVATPLQEQRLGNGSQIDNSRAASQVVLRQIPKKQENKFNIDDPIILKNASISSSYNEVYGLMNDTFNLLKMPPSNSTELRRNNLYPEIFGELISEEVSYFLNRENTSGAWDENKLNSLINEKIIISLNPDLLTAINNIHTISNEPVSIDNFITTIRSHLLNGTMYEFDPNYYKYIFNSQIKDNVTTYTVEGESYRALQAAIGLFELSSNISDFTKQSDVWKRDDLKRTRFLLEDINARIPARQLNGNSSPLYLKNSGIPIKQFSVDTSSYLEIGDGAGYYITASGLKVGEYPLLIENDLSSARYIDPKLRDGILKILGTDLGIILTVESPSSSHEFSSNYNPSADIYPMYFKLDFESIRDIENTNSVINVLSATYNRLSDEDAVRHSRNYSFNITKVNLDFRDPIIHYARDSSSIKVELDEFNFRGFGDNKSVVSENIILRSIPAAIILTPGIGSAHNPFNSRSTILSFNGEKVIRTMDLFPSFETDQVTVQKPPLDVANIYKTLGESYFGLYEKYIEEDIESDLYTFNPSSNLFKKSYFINSEYSNQLTDPEYIEPSIESKIVSIVDKLVAVSGVSSLTWWDVFRRLEVNDLGKLNSNDASVIIKSLSNGLRNGVKIYNIVNKKNMKITGIPEDSEIIDDKIILYEINRLLN